MVTYLFYNRHRPTTASSEYPSFQITFPQHETSSIQTYRRTINPIYLQIPIKKVFYAFLNKVKEDNLALENPKYSPNALDEFEQYIHNFEVEDIERIVTTQVLIINYYGQNKINLPSQHLKIILQLMNVYHSS